MSAHDSLDNRNERLEARIPARQKRRLQKAADLTGQTLTDFMLTHLQEAAERVIREYEVMELSAQDSITFVEALLNPPEPNAALKQAVDRHLKRTTG